MQTYVRQLLAGLAASLDADLVAAVQSDATSELPAPVRPLVRPRSDGWRRALSGLRGLGPATVVHGLDVDLPARPGAPTVCTVHDLSVVDLPGTNRAGRRWGERALLARSLRRADEVIAVSAFTADRVRARYGRTATVVPLAAPPDMAPPAPEEIAAARARYRLPPVFVLCVGDLGARKGVDVLAAACRRSGVPLVLAGNRTSGSVPAGCQHLGYVERASLAALYGTATVVAYPSRYEGFGLPVVEALACGAPVVSTPVPCLTELLPDAATLVPPGDVDALAAALVELVADADRRAEAVGAGPRAVAGLSWADTTARTVAVYRRLGL